MKEKIQNGLVVVRNHSQQIVVTTGLALGGLSLNATPADPVADAQAILTTAETAWGTVGGIIVSVATLMTVIFFVNKVRRAR